MKLVLGLFLVLQIMFAYAKPYTPINDENLTQHVKKITELGGRSAGSKSEENAAKYIDTTLKEIGLSPWGSQSYKHTFEFSAGTKLGPQNRLTVNSENLHINKDYRPLAFSGTGTYPISQVVFVGYGITESDEGKPESAYDSYSNIDVKNKWVLLMRYMPERISAKQRVAINRFSSERQKVMNARKHGAKGVLFVNGINTVEQEELIPLSSNSSTSNDGMPVISINKNVVDRWFKDMNKDWPAIQRKLDSGEYIKGFTFKELDVSAQVDLKQEAKKGINIMAYLKGNSDLPAVILGAHYDHLGHGETSASLAREDEKGLVHPGADDNASGVAGLLVIAEYLVMLKNKGKFSPKRDVVFAFWSGEEIGLLGSKRMLESYGEKDLSSQFMANINMDMIGRLRETLIIQGSGSSSQWNKIIEQRNAPVGLNITLQENINVPTDATNFYSHNVPVLSAFTGSHPQYHSPRDTADLINYDGIAKISKLLALITRGLALQEQPLDYQKRKPKNKKDVRNSIYLGTIPEYGYEGKGVLLSGTANGSPADRAGIKGGDILVEMSGVSIDNIYSFVDVLDALQADKTVKLKIVRDGKIVELDVTPTLK